MGRVIKLRDSSLQLIGSVHSCNESLNLVKMVSPTHLFVESTRDLIGLLRSNSGYAPLLQDLPSIIRYSDEKRIPLHPIDLSAPELTGRVFTGVSSIDRVAIWKYVLKRKLMSPIATPLFDRIIAYQNTPLDSFVTRWCVSPKLLEDVRAVAANGGVHDDIIRLVDNRQNPSSFLSCAEYDPSEYIQVCEKTSIDRRIQSAVIDFRNDYMCQQVRRTLRTIPSGSVCAVVVGENHIEGMRYNLEKGMDYVPESLSPDARSPEPASFMDQLLLAQLLHN